MLTLRLKFNKHLKWGCISDECFVGLPQHGEAWPWAFLPVFRGRAQGCKPVGLLSCHPRQNPQSDKAAHSKGKSDGPCASVHGLHRGSGTTEAETCLLGGEQRVLIEQGPLFLCISTSKVYLLILICSLGLFNCFML